MAALFEKEVVEFFESYSDYMIPPSPSTPCAMWSSPDVADSPMCMYCSQAECPGDVDCNQLPDRD